MKKIGICDGTKVEAFDEMWNSVGVYDSISHAARKLFIKSKGSILMYIYGTKNYTFKKEKRGVRSYKNGKVYHFKVVK
jgi:hypothetical protein